MIPSYSYMVTLTLVLGTLMEAGGGGALGK
jgi:hypothetical protein